MTTVLPISIQGARVFAIDALERAGAAAWQGAAGAAGPVLYAANATDVMQTSWWLQAAMIIFAGAVSALGSLLKSVRAGAKTGTASLSRQVASTAVLPGAHAADPAPVHVPAHAAAVGSMSLQQLVDTLTSSSGPAAGVDVDALVAQAAAGLPPFEIGATP